MQRDRLWIHTHTPTQAHTCIQLLTEEILCWVDVIYNGSKLGSIRLPSLLTKWNPRPAHEEGRQPERPKQQVAALSQLSLPVCTIWYCHSYESVSDILHREGFSKHHNISSVNTSTKPALRNVGTKQQFQPLCCTFVYKTRRLECISEKKRNKSWFIYVNIKVSTITSMLII